jgi:predicted transcriptional regulator
MAKRGEWHEAARIIRAAHPEWSERRIAEFLGVSKGAVWKALNPERAREFNARSNGKPERKAAKAAWDKAHPESHYDECECGAQKARNSTRCLDCRRLVEESRRALAEGMWADGWRESEIREVLGTFQVGAARQGGWNLPYRRTPKQVARITAGTREGMGLAA